jgi:hypothetical protein
VIASALRGCGGSVWCCPRSLVCRVVFWGRQAAITAAVGLEYAVTVIRECVRSNRSGKVVNHEALAGAPCFLLQHNYHLVVEPDPVPLRIPVVGRPAIFGRRHSSGW